MEAQATTQGMPEADERTVLPHYAGEMSDGQRCAPLCVARLNRRKSIFVTHPPVSIKRVQQLWIMLDSSLKFVQRIIKLEYAP